MSEPVESPATRRAIDRRILLLALPCLVLLLAHTWSYRFLTDDAFISFRYARNLVEGHGLVFNPGGERIEGYTNFLWVLALAGLAAVGLPPDVTAIPLSMMLTVALFLLLLREILRDPPERGREWLAIVPLLLLASTRSVAVWGTSGLETRLFEVLVFAGVLRLIREVHCVEQGRSGQPFAMSLLGLAALTRPEGILLGASAFAASVVWVGRAREWSRVRAMIPRLVPFVVLVAGHFAFRRVYYNDWLPNTYYAKVGGHSWWSMGLLYLAVCAFEYGLLVFVPMLVAGAREYCARGKTFTPLLFAAVIVPHAAVVAAVGGDHFEYRPLDLYFPFAFLIAYQGAKALARRSVAGTIAWVGICLFALVSIPERSRHFTPRKYLTGYPSAVEADDPRADYLNPRGWALFNLPGLRHIDNLHRRGLRELSSYWVALRREEHVLFLEVMKGHARLLMPSLVSGILPADTHIAIDCVGYVPYRTGLPTLDRLGLTDRQVALHGQHGKRRLMAHENFANPEYAREIGVDLWFLHPTVIVWRWNDPEFLEHARSTQDAFASEDAGRNGNRDARTGRRGPVGHCLSLADGMVIYAWLPQGVEAARERFPRVKIVEMSEVIRRLEEKRLGRASVTPPPGEGE